MSRLVLSSELSREALADQPGIYRREAPTTGSRRKVVRGASNK